MQKRALIVLVSSLFLASCTDDVENTSEANQEQVSEATVDPSAEPAENKVALVCDNGYAIEANYYSPDADGIMSKLTLVVTKADKTDKFELIPAVAASGAKFETPDQKISFWESLEEFTLAIDDQDVSVCKEASKEEDYSTQSGKTFIVKEDNSQSANLSKITITGKGFTDTDIAINLGEKDPVSSTFLADINQDGFEELYIATTSAGADNAGNIYGFASNNDKSISPILLPPLTEADRQKGGLFEGYQGSDDFYADNNMLVRDFPVYQEKDDQANPTGGRRLVYYTLIAAEPIWQLKVVKSEHID